jgi:hypothetical protein
LIISVTGHLRFVPRQYGKENLSVQKSRKLEESSRTSGAWGTRLSTFAVRLGHGPRLQAALGAVVLAMEKLRDRLAHSLSLAFHGCLEKPLLYRLREVTPRMRDTMAQGAVNAVLRLARQFL